MATDTKPRSLNMEEKRKLEKILLADIDNALIAFNGKHKADLRGVTEKMEANPPAIVRGLFKRILSARKEADAATKKLEDLGWCLNGYREIKLEVRSGDYAPDGIRYFKLEAEKKRTSLMELKRTYTIKLFAGDGEAAELLGSLAAELKKITG